MFIELDGRYFNTDQIIMVRPVEDEDDQCVILMTGQSALDEGFLIDLSCEEVVDELNDLDQGALLKLADKLQAEMVAERPGPKLKKK